MVDPYECLLPKVAVRFTAHRMKSATGLYLRKRVDIVSNLHLICRIEKSLVPGVGVTPPPERHIIAVQVVRPRPSVARIVVVTQ